MIARFLACSAALATSLTSFALHAGKPAEQSPFIVGVASHELHIARNNGRSSELVRMAGITSIRTDAHWAFIERQRNRLFVEPHWYTYLNGTERNRLASMFILGYGNSHYGEGQKPRSEPLRQAFNRYVDFVARTFRGRIAHYEIWNEWDMEDPVSPQMSQDYLRLVTDAAGIIRQQDPHARVLAGAVTTRGIESGFATRLVKGGLLNAVDGLSLHPYVHCRSRGRNTPEAWIEWLAQVDLELSRTAGKPVPLYLTEMSWPAHQGECGVDEVTQAAYLARSFFLARTLPNIRGMWWYDFRNDGTDPREREHNFGLVRQNLSKKPAFDVLTAISPVVGGYEYLGRVETEVADVVLLRFAGVHDEVLVGWSRGAPQSLRITSNGPVAGPLRLIDTAQPTQGRHDGNSNWQCPSNGGSCNVEVEFDHFPKILSVRATSTGF